MQNQTTGKNDTMNLDDLEFTNETPEQQSAQQLASKNRIEEIMIKNIWEIENNPIFSLGSSMRGGDDLNNGAIK